MDLHSRIKSLSLRAEILLVLTVSFGYFAGTSAVLLAIGARTFVLTNGRLARGIAAELILMGLAFWILRIRDWNFRALGLRPTLGSVAAGIPLLVAYYVLTILVAVGATAVVPSLRAEESFRFSSDASPVLLVVFLVMNSLFEETAAAGYVINSLEKRGAVAAIGLGTLVRLFYHVYQGPLAAITIIPLGVLFGAVYWRWRNLWPLMVAHTLTNLISFLVLASRVQP